MTTLKEPFTTEERAELLADGLRKLAQAVALFEAAKSDIIGGIPLNADTPSLLRTRAIRKGAIPAR